MTKHIDESWIKGKLQLFCENTKSEQFFFLFLINNPLSYIFSKSTVSLHNLIF